jgi:hypothetical protein
MMPFVVLAAFTAHGAYADIRVLRTSPDVAGLLARAEQHGGG